MTLDQAIVEVQQIIGWRSDKVVEITRALSYSQTEREKPGITFPWWMKVTSTITTVAGQNQYAIPTTYIQESEEREGGIYGFTTGLGSASKTAFLRRMSFKDAQIAFYGMWPPDTATPNVAIRGRPSAYAVTENALILYPTPDAVYSLLWKHWGKASAQVLGQENTWLREAPWVLIGDAAKKIAADLGNTSAVAVATEILARAEQNLFKEQIAREEAGRHRSMGSKL